MQRKMNRRREEWGSLEKAEVFIWFSLHEAPCPVPFLPSDRFPIWYPIPAYYQDPCTEAHFNKPNISFGHLHSKNNSLNHISRNGRKYLHKSSIRRPDKGRIIILSQFNFQSCANRRDSFHNHSPPIQYIMF